MARSKNSAKFEFGRNPMYKNLIKDDPDRGNHVAAKVAYCRTKKYGFSINDALEDWNESEAETSRGDNPLSS